MNEAEISKSPVMNQLRELASRISVYPTTVLIEGETGVGKEVMANWIHKSSQRMNMPFIKINCGALPEGLIESELFGYEKGAFTGAKREGNAGLFEHAHKGTLLLDEIRELSHSMQAKVLRVLQDREVRRVGGSWSKAVDVRIIASTNQSLKTLVEEGKFRKDLYYRLNVVHLVIPPLRERRDDIGPLLDCYLNYYCNEYGISKKFTNEALIALLNHNYLGNVRELRNIVEYACITAIGDEITVNELPTYLKEDISKVGSLDAIVEEAEKNAIKNALNNAPSIRKAAANLQISNATLLRKIKKYGL
ncbi:MAG: sigma-54 interaction domain-containing protein [Clostridia bacterium]